MFGIVGALITLPIETTARTVPKLFGDKLRNKNPEYLASCFPSVKKWVHFLLHHDLRVCSGCRRRATSKNESRRWICNTCRDAVADRRSRKPIILHPMIRALLDGDAFSRPRCDRTGQRLELQDTWLSDDGRKIYHREVITREIAVTRLEKALFSLDLTASHGSSDAPSGESRRQRPHRGRDLQPLARTHVNCQQPASVLAGSKVR